jgi:hypothetical protein
MRRLDWIEKGASIILPELFVEKAGISEMRIFFNMF